MKDFSMDHGLTTPASKIEAAKGVVLKVFEDAAKEMHSTDPLSSAVLEIMAPVVATAIEQALKKAL